MKKYLFIAIFLLLFTNSAPLANTSQVQNGKNQSIENALYHYFNDESDICLLKLELIENELNRPEVYEYKARCYWQLIKKLTKTNFTKQAEKNESDSDLDKKLFEKLEKNFFENIEKAIQLSNEQFEKEKSPESAHSLAMALSTKSAYLFQIYGRKRAVEAALLLDRAVEKAQFCVNAQPPYCLAYLPLGTIQYFVTKEITGIKWIGYTFFTRYRAPHLYETINFDKDEAIEFIEVASRCDGPDFRRTESLFILQEFLMDIENNQKKRRNYDLKALPILEELVKNYPKNKKIRNNLTLVYFHLKNKTR